MTYTKTIPQLAEEMKSGISPRAVALSDFIDALDPSDSLASACRNYAEATITEKPEELCRWFQTMGGIAGFWMETVISEGKYCARPAYYIFYDHVRAAWVELETETLSRLILKDAIRFSTLVSLGSITAIDGYLTSDEIERLPAFLDRCAECTTGDELMDEWESFKKFLTLSRRFTA